MISHKIAVHQLIDVCTTRVVHVHISCWTSAQQLLCDRRTYIFRRHLLNIPTTSIISFILNFHMWLKNGLKAQKLLAQGIALGIMAISKAPCKGKSFVYCPVF